MLVDIAEIWAASATAAAADVDLAEDYARRAVAVLRQAVSAGYRNPASLDSSAYLNSLRTRADYQDVRNGLGTPE